MWRVISASGWMHGFHGLTHVCTEDEVRLFKGNRASKRERIVNTERTEGLKLHHCGGSGFVLEKGMLSSHGGRQREMQGHGRCECLVREKGRISPLVALVSVLSGRCGGCSGQVSGWGHKEAESWKLLLPPITWGS